MLLGAGRAAHDPEVTARLVTLVDDLGLDTVAELWSGRPGRSLPGALWRLMRCEMVRRNPVQSSMGMPRASVSPTSPTPWQALPSRPSR